MQCSLPHAVAIASGQHAIGVPLRSRRRQQQPAVRRPSPLRSGQLRRGGTQQSGPPPSTQQHAPPQHFVSPQHTYTPVKPNKVWLLCSATPALTSYCRASPSIVEAAAHPSAVSSLCLQTRTNSRQHEPSHVRIPPVLNPLLFSCNRSTKLVRAENGTTLWSVWVA